MPRRNRLARLESEIVELLEAWGEREAEYRRKAKGTENAIGFCWLAQEMDKMQRELARRIVMPRMRTTDDVNVTAKLAGMTAGLVRLCKTWEAREDAYRVQMECSCAPAARRFEHLAGEIKYMRREVEAILKEAGNG